MHKIWMNNRCFSLDKVSQQNTPFTQQYSQVWL